MRRPIADEWESRHDRPFWASGKARSAIDVVWRQAVRAEARGATNTHAATLLWDAEAFFERVSHKKLAARARSTGFPEQLLGPAIAMYRAPRLICMNVSVAREALPRRGVVAGCGYATTLMKVYCLQPFDDYVAKVGCNCDDFDAYVDDFAVTVEGETTTDVVERLDRAQQVFREVLEVDLEAVVAMSKAGLVTTSEQLAKQVRRRIGALAGREGEPVASLGVHLSGGRMRTRRRCKKGRGKRLLGAFARRHRIASMANVLSRRQLRTVYAAGVAPAADYEAAVNGLADDEVLMLRRTAAAAVAPRGRGRSLTMAMLMAGMPTWCSELAPALQYARATWRASNGATRGNDLDLGEIARTWNKMHDEGYLSRLVKPRASEAYGSGGASERKWAACRGPIGAMVLSLDRVRWQVKGPFVWTDDWGEDIILTTTSPALLKDLLKEAVQREAQRKVAATWSDGGDASFSGRRVCVDVFHKVITSARHLAPLERGALASTVADAVWTRDRAHRAGYEVDNICPMCGAAGDTAHHRVWWCPASRPVRDKLPRWLVEEARQALPSCRFWTSGVFPHPGDAWPRPSTVLMAECVDEDGNEAQGVDN